MCCLARGVPTQSPCVRTGRLADPVPATRLPGRRPGPPAGPDGSARPTDSSRRPSPSASLPRRAPRQCWPTCTRRTGARPNLRTNRRGAPASFEEAVDQAHRRDDVAGVLDVVDPSNQSHDGVVVVVDESCSSKSPAMRTARSLSDMGGAPLVTCPAPWAALTSRERLHPSSASREQLAARADDRSTWYRPLVCRSTGRRRYQVRSSALSQWSVARNPCEPGL